MRVGRFRGLRFEILGNLAAVSLISLLLTGFGVWFINGKHMLQQHLLQGRLLVQSFAEETLELLPAHETGTPLDDPASRTAVQDLMRRYRDKDSRIQLNLLGPDLRVLASTGRGVSGAPSGEEALRACFRSGEPCTRLDGESTLFGSFDRATPILPG